MFETGLVGLAETQLFFFFFYALSSILLELWSGQMDVLTFPV